jgi:hypothetical protein
MIHIEIEDNIVESDIYIVDRIAYAQTRVSVPLIELFARCTGKQRDRGLIAQALRLKAGRYCQTEKGDMDTKFMPHTNRYKREETYKRYRATNLRTLA